MAQLTRAAFARLVGVSRAIIGRHVRDGKLKINIDNRLDTEDPDNQRYIQAVEIKKMSGDMRMKTAQAEVIEKPLKKNKLAIENKPVKKTSQKKQVSQQQAGVENLSLLELQEEKLKAEILHKRKQTQITELKIELEKKRVIPVERMNEIFNGVGIAIKQNLLDLPKKIIIDAEIIAREGSHKLELFLQDEIAKAIKQAKIDSLKNFM